MNLTKKIATLGALAVIGAFTVSNAANVGVINEEAIYTGYNGFGAIQMQIEKLRGEYGPKLQTEFNKLNNFKTDAEKQAYFDKNVRSIQCISAIGQKSSRSYPSYYKRKRYRCISS